MKKNISKIVFILIMLGLIVCIFLNIFEKYIVNNSNYILNKNVKDNNIKTAIKATIIEVYENKKQLLVSDFQNPSEQFYIDYLEENNLKFEKNQNIIIYYDNIPTQSSSKLNNITKIEIIKENNVDINDVNVNIIQFNVNEIIFILADKTISEFNINYEIYKEIENNSNIAENYYTEEKVTSASTSTSSYTRKKSRIYL